MQFIPDVTRVTSSTARNKLPEAWARQKQFAKSMATHTSRDIVSLDRENRDGVTLRQMLMGFTSHRSPATTLFHTVDKRSPEAPTKFKFHPANRNQAETTIKGLIPLLRHRLRVDNNSTLEKLSDAENMWLQPKLYQFFESSAVEDSYQVEWDEELQECVSAIDMELDALLEVDSHLHFDLPPALKATQRSSDKPAPQPMPPPQYQAGEDDSLSTFNSGTFSFLTNQSTQSQAKKRRTSSKSWLAAHPDGGAERAKIAQLEAELQRAKKQMDAMMAKLQDANILPATPTKPPLAHPESKIAEPPDGPSN